MIETADLSPSDAVLDRDAVRAHTTRIVAEMQVIDMHTHLFPPQFEELASWGIDDLLTYHYLVAEAIRSGNLRPDEFQAMPKTSQADLVWQILFVRNTPLSEATRGVITVLSALGLDPVRPDLREARDFFRAAAPAEHLGRVLDHARVDLVVMTNDPFNAAEARVWNENAPVDPRFRAALRIDTLLNDWATARRALEDNGHAVGNIVDDQAVAHARRFVDTWIRRMDPLYVAVSLPDDFSWPAEDARTRLIRDVVLPACRDHRLPFAMMIGVRRRVNPALHDAGDALGRADVSVVHRLCREHPDNRFLVTMLSRENQHELCVAARKFSNLMPFGCWWFLNNPSIVSEITRERLELLGTTFIPQHSDARVLEQLLYKWAHSRRDVADALADQYTRLIDSGRPVTTREIARDVHRLFVGNFQQWTTLGDSAGSIPPNANAIPNGASTR
ncbi:MAG: glucuronate isomerase [Acidobacteria bacterium]|nr:glucuronate isomerase [Acidobacteriota bacterium]